MRLFFAVVTLVGVFAASAARSTASFDCDKATTVEEKLICSTPVLTSLDLALAALWKKAEAAYVGADALRASLVKGQTTWIRFRDAACRKGKEGETSPDQASCLAGVYQQRLALLTQQLAAHQKAPYADFDRVWDQPDVMLGTTAEQVGTLYYGTGLDADSTVPRVPQTCRELYTLLSGRWSYTEDMLGADFEMTAKTQCAFALIEAQRAPYGAAAIQDTLERALHEALDKLQDGAPFHNAQKIAYGDFTHRGRSEIMALVFSYDRSQLHFLSLYIGSFGPGRKFELKKIDLDAPLQF
jgi:uncharacterized protein